MESAIKIDDVMNWGRFLNSLSAVGKEATFSFKKSGLLVRMMMSGNSLYCVGKVDRKFFSEYTEGDINVDLDVLKNISSGGKKDTYIKIVPSDNTFDYIIGGERIKRYRLNMIDTITTIVGDKEAISIKKLKWKHKFALDISDYVDIMRGGRKINKYMIIGSKKNGLYISFESAGTSSMTTKVGSDSFDDLFRVKFNTDFFFNIITPFLVDEKNNINFFVGKDYPMLMRLEFGFVKLKLILAPMIDEDVIDKTVKEVKNVKEKDDNKVE